MLNIDNMIISNSYFSNLRAVVCAYNHRAWELERRESGAWCSRIDWFTWDFVFKQITVEWTTVFVANWVNL